MKKLLMILPVFLIGCGVTDTPRPKGHTVNGSVIGENGKSIAKGRLTFYPETSGLTTEWADIKNEQFEINESKGGISPGNYTVGYEGPYLGKGIPNEYESPKTSPWKVKIDSNQKVELKVKK